MRAIAEGGIARLLTCAKPDLPGLGRLVLLRRELGPLVRPVAKRLLGRLAAGAPPIGLAGFHIHGKRDLAGDDR